MKKVLIGLTMILAGSVFVFECVHAQESFWQQHADNPVIALGGSGAFDERDAYDACVIKKDDVYHMWYRGERDSHNTEIGYATSTDGMSWTKQNGGNPVMSFPWVDENNHGANLMYPNVVIDGSGNWRMYYVREYIFDGEEGPGEQPNEIWTAQSTDGVSWSGHTLLYTDADHPCPLYENGTYHLWYTNGDENQMLYATSSDGVSFSAPATVNWPAAQSWEVIPMILPDMATKTDQGFQVWFSGLISGDTPFYKAAIGTATSADGIQWSKNPDNPVFFNGHLGVEDSSAMLCSVVEDDGNTKLYYSTGMPGGDPDALGARLGLAVRRISGDYNGDKRLGMEDALYILEVLSGKR